MKLSQWAKKHSITYQAAWKQFKAGKITGAYQLATGTIVVPEDNSPLLEEKVVIYARVSSSEQKADLERQKNRLLDFCAAKGWEVVKTYCEVGSGLNDKRPKLEKILLDKSITKIVVEHKDRLARFGLNYIELLLGLERREIIIVNNVSDSEDDLMQDFVSIITSFCARLYGLRRSKRKTEQLIKALEKESN